MSIRLRKNPIVVIDELENTNGGECNWTFSITKNGRNLIIGIHWSGKAEPTHIAVVDEATFIQSIRDLAE